MATSEYIRELNKLRDSIVIESNYSKRINMIYDLYIYLKNIENHDSSLYDFFMRDLFTLNDTISNTPIIQYTPKFVLLDTFGKIAHQFNIDDFSSSTELLDHIVLLVRNLIFYENQNSFYEEHYKTFKRIELGNKCKYISEYVCKILNQMNIKNSLIKIFPAFDKKQRIENYLRLHCFVYLEIDNEKYLIDCTYGQFFKTINNNLELCGIKNAYLSFPGIYMLQNNSRLETARILLEKGWIRLTEQNFKDYCDGFALSFLNGLYYESKGYVDYELEYSCEVYESFFRGYNSMIDKESESFLGIQKRTLDSKIDFSTDRIIYEDKNRVLVKRQ